MTDQVRLIKKYPNRRLYDTMDSGYITLADVKKMILDNVSFKVVDAKSNEDLTRQILLQIILEEESGGVPMFSTQMLANIIRYYGHSMQGLMGSYLERSIATFHEAQKRFQDQAQTLYGELPKVPAEAWAQLMTPGQQMGGYLEKGAKAVIDMQEELRNQALKLFSGFPYAGGSAGSAPAAEPKARAKAARGTRKPRTRK